MDLDELQVKSLRIDHLELLQVPTGSRLDNPLHVLIRTSRDSENRRYATWNPHGAMQA